MKKKLARRLNFQRTALQSGRNDGCGEPAFPFFQIVYNCNSRRLTAFDR
jgi:hypothetical protein